MAATAFTTITSFEMILFGKTAIAFWGKIEVPILYRHMLFIVIHPVKVRDE